MRDADVKMEKKRNLKQASFLWLAVSLGRKASLGNQFGELAQSWWRWHHSNILLSCLFNAIVSLYLLAVKHNLDLTLEKVLKCWAMTKSSLKDMKTFKVSWSDYIFNKSESCWYFGCSSFQGTTGEHVFFNFHTHQLLTSPDLIFTAIFHFGWKFF